jgi:hypothetical protein
VVHFGEPGVQVFKGFLGKGQLAAMEELADVVVDHIECSGEARLGRVVIENEVR